MHKPRGNPLLLTVTPDDHDRSVFWVSSEHGRQPYRCDLEENLITITNRDGTTEKFANGECNCPNFLCSRKKRVKAGIPSLCKHLVAAHIKLSSRRTMEAWAAMTTNKTKT